MFFYRTFINKNEVDLYWGDDADRNDGHDGGDVYGGDDAHRDEGGYVYVRDGADTIILMITIVICDYSTYVCMSIYICMTSMTITSICIAHIALYKVVSVIAKITMKVEGVRD